MGYGVQAERVLPFPIHRLTMFLLSIHRLTDLPIHPVSSSDSPVFSVSICAPVRYRVAAGLKKGRGRCQLLFRGG
jgi:hypothetical protein